MPTVAHNAERVKENSKRFVDNFGIIHFGPGCEGDNLIWCGEHAAYFETEDRGRVIKVAYDTAEARESIQHEQFVYSHLWAGEGYSGLFKHYPAHDRSDAIALEAANGKHLPCYLRQAGITYKDKLQIWLHILDTIGFIHTKKSIHGRVCTDNIIVLPDGEIKLCNLASVEVETRARPNPPKPYYDPGRHIQIKFGWVHHVKPLARNMKNTDKFSAGCILYEMVMGREPFLNGEETTLDDVPVGPRELITMAFSCWTGSVDRLRIEAMKHLARL